MILGVDIGGTKTLLGSFTENGELRETVRFETPKEYKNFLVEFQKAFDSLKTKDFSLGVAAAPGKIDRSAGIVREFGNLEWTNTPLEKDLSGIIRCNIYIENDAKLAALSEANAWDVTDKKVLYITVSTGIGTGVVVNGLLDKTLLDSEGGHMLLPYKGELLQWEDFASGKAITQRYGKKASEITDEKQWREIAANLCVGIIDLCSVIEPDIVIIGGGVGSHFKKYEKYLLEDIMKSLPDLVSMPKIVAAKEAEMAALKGCLVYAKQKLAKDS